MKKVLRNMTTFTGQWIGSSFSPPSNHKFGTFKTSIQSGYCFLSSLSTTKYQQITVCTDIFNCSILKRRTSLSELSELSIEVLQTMVFVSPGKSPSIQRIFKTLHSGFITIENSRGARKCEEEHSCQTKTSQAKLPFFD